MGTRNALEHRTEGGELLGAERWVGKGLLAAETDNRDRDRLG